MQTQLEIQQEKLKDASSTIHNNIGQALVCIRLGLLKAAQQYADTELAHNSSQLARIIKDLRDLNTSLDPESFLKNGIAAALEEELEKATRNSATRFRLQYTGQPSQLNPDISLIVFRILQECIQVAAAEGLPENMLLSILYTQNHIIFSLKDDGRYANSVSPLLATRFLEPLEEKARIADLILQAGYTPDYGSHVTIKLSKTR